MLSNGSLPLSTHRRLLLLLQAERNSPHMGTPSLPTSQKPHLCLLRREKQALFLTSLIRGLAISSFCPLLICSSILYCRKKGIPSRAAMTNEELCSEIRELAASVGQPEDWVPSTKELCEFGRKDLANIVRRKGYKLITELLRNANKRDYGIEEVSLEDGDSNIGIDEPSEIEGRNLIESTEFISTFDSPLAKTYKIGNGAVNIDASLHICDPLESFNGSLHLKAANFIKTGELGTTEDAFKIENVDTPTQTKVNSDILSSNGADAVHVAFQQALPLLAMLDLGRDHSASNVGSNGDNANVASEDGEMDNQTEIDHLKAMLNQKEMELSELKQQIEKEKQALYILQDKAKHEIGSIHRSVSAKDFELRAVEESLSGLKEVQIEYWADGETVEFAGSFNGWHHRIKMDLNSSSRTINSPASRNSKLWSAVLWLYPGFYEIKFIVDGQWRIDSWREMTTIGNITNNVLRVER